MLKDITQYLNKNSRTSSIADFQIIQQLGEGSFSQVLKVMRKSDGQIYALKQVRMEYLNQKEQQNSLNEVRILASIRDPFIIGYKQAFYDEKTSSLCIVMQIAGGGDLSTLIKEKLNKQTFIDEQIIWNWLLQMIQALQRLHDSNIIHRDLKCANIFLTEDKTTIKLGDLNVSQITKPDQMSKTQTGTPYYTSPEVWKDQPYNLKVDIWAMGCVIYQLCTLSPPFKANDMEGLYQKVTKGIYQKIPSRYSSDLASIISQCLQMNPTFRPDCDQLLRSPPISQRINMVECIQKKIIRQSNSNEFNGPSELLSTIRLPKNLKQLKNQLPKPSYNCNRSFDLSQRPSSPILRRYRDRSIDAITNIHNQQSLQYQLNAHNQKYQMMYQNQLQVTQENNQEDIQYLKVNNEQHSDNALIFRPSCINNMKKLPKVLYLEEEIKQQDVDEIYGGRRKQKPNVGVYVPITRLKEKSRSKELIQPEPTMKLDEEQDRTIPPRPPYSGRPTRQRSSSPRVNTEEAERNMANPHRKPLVPLNNINNYVNLNQFSKDSNSCNSRDNVQKLPYLKNSNSNKNISEMDSTPTLGHGGNQENQIRAVYYYNQINRGRDASVSPQRSSSRENLKQNNSIIEGEFTIFDNILKNQQRKLSIR